MNASEGSLLRASDNISRDGAARHIVRRLFAGHTGSLTVRLWNGEIEKFGPGRSDFTLVFHHPQPLRNAILRRDPLHLVDAYLQGTLDVDGDIFATVQLKAQLQSTALSVVEKLKLFTSAMFLGDDVSYRSNGEPRRFAGAHRDASSTASRDAIAFHYDVSNAFYRLWLDEEMVYSCAYFEEAGDSLDQAQRQKLDHICRKLRLKPGERLLDIGCGWGALLCWAAKRYGVRAHGITLSQEQYDYARQRVQVEGLDALVSVELRDFRELPGEAAFDKIASIGMFEHVGLANLPAYYATVQRLLRPGGLFLNHGITSDEEGWRKSVGTEFINRYVFPGGQLDTVSNIQRGMEHGGFEILDVEALRGHYALTLRHWVQRLERRHAEARAFVSESVYRLWRLYMAACALQFEQGNIGVYQILAARRGDADSALPLTRRDIYC